MLGGGSKANLNFPVSKDGTTLLMIAAAKGNKIFLEVMISNRQLSINQTDKFGVNAFWIACFYGKLDAIHLLASRSID